jgi:magnesium transporter
LQFELTEEFVQEIRTAIHANDLETLKVKIADFYSEDILPIFYELKTEEQVILVKVLDEETVGRILTDMDADTRNQLFKKFDPEQIATYINEVYSDDAADILNSLPVKRREEIISYIKDPVMALHINELLRYDEDCAGGIMAKELIKANVGWTVKQTIDEIRSQAENVEKLYTIYVVNDLDELLGRVSLKKIILAKDNTKIEEIYEKNIHYVETYLDVKEVVEIMQKYDLESIPVVNVQKKLVGRITIDDVVDVIKEQNVEDINAITGISANVEEDDTIWKLSKARLPWLIIGMFGGLLGATVMGFFEQNIVLVPAMAFFVPLITATGGNVGVQTSSLIVQSLANSDGIEENNWVRLYRIILVALLNALVICSIVFSFVLIINQPIGLAVVVSTALFFVVILASVMGTVTPLLLDKFGVNPALASGPFITTANDILGLLVYFGVATLLFNL